MNKRGLFGILGNLILIGIILILLVLALSPLLKKSSSTPIRIIDEWISKLFFGEEEKDLTTLNDKARDNFNLLIQDMKECLNKKQNNCWCSGYNSNGFNDFSKHHRLDVLENNKLRLLLVKDNNELTMADSNIVFPLCYATKTGIQNSKFIKIMFDQDSPYLKDDKDNEASFAKGALSVFYKDDKGNICWYTKDLSLRVGLPSLQAC